MNKIIFIFSVLMFFCIINVKNVMAQNTNASSSVTAIVVNTSFQNTAAQINYTNGFSQIVPTNSVVPDKIFLISAVNEKQASVTHNIASFSISNEKINSFTVSLPSQPVLLTNTKSGNTIQVSDWKSDSYSVNGAEQKNVKVINLGASLKMSSLNKDNAGEYIGSYSVTLIY